MRKNNNNKLIHILIAVIAVESLLLIASFRKRPEPLPQKTPPVVKEKKAQKPKEKPKEKSEVSEGRIAIVLDDWGYTQSNLKILKEIKEPLNLAILPNLDYTYETVVKAKELGFEIILHLPLEPYKKYNLEKNTILINMPREEVLKILDDDLKSVPGVSGVSNHMGSKATEDEALMKVIFSRLKKKRLYFLDSFTSKTICKELASTMGVRYACRHVFLDNSNDPEYITKQLEILTRIAKQQGAAIGIGHSRINTLETLLKVIPQLKKRGFKFVFVSELVR